MVRWTLVGEEEERLNDGRRLFSIDSVLEALGSRRKRRRCLCGEPN